MVEIVNFENVLHVFERCIYLIHLSLYFFAIKANKWKVRIRGMNTAFSSFRRRRIFANFILLREYDKKFTAWRNFRIVRFFFFFTREMIAILSIKTWCKLKRWLLFYPKSKFWSLNWEIVRLWKISQNADVCG